MESSDEGWVYFVVNRHFPPGWIKIGKSADPDRRLSKYQTGDPTRSYRIIHRAQVDNRHAIEWATHRRLVKLGYERKGEWFRVDLETAKAALDRAINEYEGDE